MKHIPKRIQKSALNYHGLLFGRVLHVFIVIPNMK